MHEQRAAIRGRVRIEVRRSDGTLAAAREASNVVLHAGAEIVAGLFARAPGATGIDLVRVGFGVDPVDVDATGLTPPSTAGVPPEEQIPPEALENAVEAGDFAVETDADARLVRVAIATAFSPTRELQDVTEAGLLAGGRLYNQVVFEPVTLRPGQDVTFFWEVDFPYGH